MYDETIAPDNDDETHSDNETQNIAPDNPPELPDEHPEVADWEREYESLLDNVRAFQEKIATVVGDTSLTERSRLNSVKEILAGFKL